ncbi:MAG: 7-carboxy-7-deazaguanine synthase QueE [Geobacter sp.]|nr:7-carboxy-7-deazaguanine synthase QueE [Geobacter sp.]
MKSDTADLIEVFSSIQGEGDLIGRRQVFIRFRGCNLDCDYCDTNAVDFDHCRFELTPGRQDFQQMANPVSMPKVIELLERWQRGWPGVHHSISLTGGEPLLQVDAIHTWLPELKGILPVHLETNGVLHIALFKIVNDLDYISMDIKLPSSSGESGLWDHHHAFLETAAATEVSVKTVVNCATEEWEIERAARMIATVNDNIPLIIQPETSPDDTIKLSQLRLIEFQDLASGILADVRIIPQTHRFIGLL